MQEKSDQFDRRAESLRASALDENNDFAYNIISVNIIRAYYSNSYTFHYMMNFDEATNHCELLNHIIRKYQDFSSNENMVATLSLQYELFHYIGETEKAAKSSAEMLQLIETYDLKDFERKYKILINGGTRHERFMELMKASFSKKDELKAELDTIPETMKSIDRSEKRNAVIPEGHYQIHLLPIVKFSYPKEDFEMAMDILDVTSEAREQFRHLSTFVLPIANVFNSPIKSEGPGTGNSAAGVKGYRNALRIRKVFNERRYLRF